MISKLGVAAALLLGACASGPATDSLTPAGPAGAAAFDHLALYVGDLDRSAAFYKGVFGFGEVPAPVGFARWLVMGNGVMLHIVRGRPAPADATKWDHFAVSCADMDRMIASLEAAKIGWSDIEGKPTPQVRADGVKQIFVRDPDGYWVEINDALKPR